MTDILEKETALKGVILGMTGDKDIEGLDQIVGKHSTLMIKADGCFKDLSFNKTALRRMPDLIVMGDVHADTAVSEAVELAMTGSKVIGKAQVGNISEIIPSLVRLLPLQDQNMMAYDLVNSINVIVHEKDGVISSLVFDDSLKEELSSLLKKQGFDTKALKDAINSVMAVGAA